MFLRGELYFILIFFLNFLFNSSVALHACVLCRFKVVDLLTMASQHQNAVLDSEQERPMLEGALTFLVILTSLRIHLGKLFNTGQPQSVY